MSELSVKSNVNVKLCVLVSDENPDIKFVLLDNEPLILGKTQYTGITDQRVSKNQMKFVADYSTAQVLVEQVGNYQSAVNNESMIRGEKRFLHHGDNVALLFRSKYTYHLDFVTAPSYSVVSNKRTNNCLDKEISPKKPSLDLDKWHSKDGNLMVYNSSNIVHKDKIAAFNMDGTLIVTLSGNVFPVDENDWKIYSSEVTTSINKLSEDGYKIVIFTNQELGNEKITKKFKKKIEIMFNVIRIPFQIFVATKNDIFRKPAPGMWNTFVSDYNGGLSVDMDKSFFCGDAAGRPSRTSSDGKLIKRDHSCCDRLFAMNIGLKFYTPEEYFLKKFVVETFELPAFNPHNVMGNVLYTAMSKNLFSSRQKMIIMVGCPGSGKSFFASNNVFCHGCVQIINRDPNIGELVSWKKCVTAAKNYLNRSWSVVIDDTNPNIESRKRFIDVAKSLNILCQVFLMNVSKDHGKHNIKFRELTNTEHHKTSDSEFNKYFLMFEEPSKREGIDEIFKINFVPNFKNPEHKKLYKMYLL